MNKKRILGLIAATATVLAGTTAAAISAAVGGCQSQPAQAKDISTSRPPFRLDTIVMPWGEVRVDTVALNTNIDSLPGGWRTEADVLARQDSTYRYKTLTDADFRIVAAELGVEVAAIKAVVRCEAGAAMEGFWAPGVPVINFDRSMYNRSKPPTNVKAPASETVPAGITSAYGRREWSQLVAARKVNRDKANMGTFWGMFQIGGFNYKICGCQTVSEFVERMSYSEFEQLELFAIFIRNTGMLPALKAKNWSAFARKYNGASYARRGYHTKMAAAYAKYKKEEK